MEFYAFTSPSETSSISKLRVKSDHPVELVPGFHRILESLSDCDVTHSFELIRKLDEKTEGGYFYSWYLIKDYTRNVDKAVAVARTANSIAETNNIAFVTLAEAGSIDDVTSSEHPNAFSYWEDKVAYKQGNIRRYGENLYRCLQNHTSQEGWEPDKTASLWKKIGDPTVEYPDWSQPVGAGDAYMSGDRVNHNSKNWVSNVDNNVWEPGVYGWDEVTQ